MGSDLNLILTVSAATLDNVVESISTFKTQSLDSNLNSNGKQAIALDSSMRSLVFIFSNIVLLPWISTSVSNDAWVSVSGRKPGDPSLNPGESNNNFY